MLAGAGPAGIYRLARLEEAGLTTVAALPFSIRVLLEAALRNCDGYEISEEDVKNLAGWQAASPAPVEIPFKPARVVLQDFTGVPAVVDLAAMRSAMKRLGGDPGQINPLIPVDLVIDHSVQVDRFGSPEALARNVDLRRQKWRVKEKELELIAAKNYLMPQLDAVGQYRWRGLGDDYWYANRSAGEFDTAMQNLTGGDYQDWRVTRL